MAFSLSNSIAADPVLALMERFRADRRPRKIDLGVGVYRDEHGATPILAAVKAAERRLLEEQSSKAYLSCDGDPAFVDALGAAVFGSLDSYAPRFAGLQTVGGTGALRLASDLLAVTASGRRVWIGLPTWPNHVPIFRAAGLEVMSVDSSAELLEALNGAAAGDAVLVHGCCHNPTGIDPDAGFWTELAEQVVARGLVPVVDLAYQGLGSGFDSDAAGLRALAQRVPELIVAYSCDKNFGVYRDRVGAIFVTGPTPAHTEALRAWLFSIARTQYSMPPDHGAATVGLILRDPRLQSVWRAELEHMRRRIVQLRRLLADRGRIGRVDLGALAQGRGMFALLPLAESAIERLRTQFGIYMAASGRINIAGLAESDVERFAAALGAVQLDQGSVTVAC
jgi:aromatic-amino-acid transaminase